MAIKPLPLGLAFIQATTRVSPRDRYLIEAGYEWLNATIGTAAGWVRPIGKLKAVPLSVNPNVLIS
jgi:hypothetical protein